MITIDPASQSEQDNYHLLIGSVIPRPIALVTTLSLNGTLNAAPFSYFNIVTANPPMISVSVQRRNGVQKDTARNAVERGAFVVHMTDESYIVKMNLTSADLLPNESEVLFAGLTPVDSVKVAVPGLSEAKIRMECVVEEAIPLGGTKAEPTADLLIGRVVCFHVDEAIYQYGQIDADLLKPISRLSGDLYCKLGQMFAMERP